MNGRLEPGLPATFYLPRPCVADVLRLQGILCLRTRGAVGLRARVPAEVSGRDAAGGSAWSTAPTGPPGLPCEQRGAVGLRARVPAEVSGLDSDAKACAYNKLFRIPAKRPQVVGFIEDVVWQYSDHEHFRRHFRLARPVAEKLVAEFAVSSMCPSSTHGGVQAKSAETHVLTFIWYAANKTGMRDVASRFDMSESTVYRVLQRVAPFLMTLGPSVIKFPADLENLTSSFEVSLENIKKACELDAKHQLKLLPHLKLRNLDPSHFEKMNLATAHALFHHAIAAGLRKKNAELLIQLQQSAKWSCKRVGMRILCQSVN
ncbi:hypothetical protein MRX96_009784 [Rhipicephalus microplus]